jgi:rhamnose transport system ATP-binding protein
VLRDGQYVATKPVSETDHDDLIAMMVGRTIDQMFPKLEAEVGAPVLEVRNLVRRPLTRGVSFTLRAGEIVGLAGLVGSGRSEVAQVIFGINPAESGEILIDGRPVRIRQPGEAMKLGIAYVPEDRGVQGLVRQMNVRENAAMAMLRELSNGLFLDFRRERELARKTIQDLSVRAYSINQVVNKLSGGNQQKIVVGKWLARRPRVLIMDEPTRGIDVGAKAEIHRLMSQLAQQGMAVLMISSELPEVLGMSDRILVMRGGRIVAEFTREEATQEKVVTAMITDQTETAGKAVVGA